MIHFKNLTRKTLLIGLIPIVTGLVLAGIAVSHLVQTNNATQNQIAKDGTSPSFTAALPKGKSIDDLGGWKKQNPPSGEPYYVFTDSINGTPIRVSQQALPDTFKTDTKSKITELAKSFNATQTFDVNGTTIYIGTSAKGPQSVIFNRDQVLILIVSDQTIPEDAWKNYITSLI